MHFWYSRTVNLLLINNFMFKNIYWVFSGDGGLSKEKVDMIMEKGLSKQEEVAQYHLPDLNKSKDDHIRSSRIAKLDDEAVYECIRPFVWSANENAGWRLDLRHIEMVQFTKYRPNQHYNWHIDGYCDHNSSKVLSSQDYKSQGMVMPITETDNPDFIGMCRKVSITVNLSDPEDYEGGDLWLTHLPSDSNSDKLETFTNPDFRTKGAVVVFPSWVRHRVTPVTKGTRYSAVAWFNGPPIR